MYAIIETGGKQYKVEKDMLVKVEKLNAEVGANVELDALMLVDDKGQIKTGDKAAKVLVCHYKSKKQIRKRQGHRQPYTELKIVSIG